MGFLDKLFRREKSPEREGGSGGDAGGREGARVTEPARTSGEGTRQAQPPGAERPEAPGPDRGPN